MDILRNCDGTKGMKKCKFCDVITSNYISERRTIWTIPTI